MEKNERFEMRTDATQLERIDNWRFEQADKPSRSEAVRRLIDIGLENAHMSAGERMIILLLVQLMNPKNSSLAIDHEYITEALLGHHDWALKMEYGYIFESYRTSESSKNEVISFLDMFDFIEDALKNLSKKERENLEKNKTIPRFIGFDHNKDIEREYTNIMSFIIRKANRFKNFSGKEHLNSHTPMIDRYRRMYSEFSRIRPHLIGRTLNAEELRIIWNAERCAI